MDFNELWKVKALKNLLKFADEKTKIIRNEKRAIERDLNLIRYGFEQGKKQNDNNRK